MWLLWNKDACREGRRIWAAVQPPNPLGTTASLSFSTSWLLWFLVIPLTKMAVKYKIFNIETKGSGKFNRHHTPSFAETAPPRSIYIITAAWTKRRWKRWRPSVWNASSIWGSRDKDRLCGRSFERKDLSGGSNFDVSQTERYHSVMRFNEKRGMQV